MQHLIRLWQLLPKEVQRLFVWSIQKNRPLHRWLFFRYIDARDSANGNKDGLPSAKLRYLVSGGDDVESFIKIGKTCAGDIQSSLAKVGHELRSFKRILDFGCGCGRTLRHLPTHAPSSQIFGTDIDANAIAWCKQELNFASFSVNGSEPPTAYAADSFDLIYAISVFTHLSEDSQHRWLAELRRIAEPGAVLLLTVDSSRPGENGFMFERYYENGLVPAWFQNASHSQEYVFATFGSYFDVLAYFPRGMNNHQDVVVLQKQK